MTIQKLYYYNFANDIFHHPSIFLGSSNQAGFQYSYWKNTKKISVSLEYFCTITNCPRFDKFIFGKGYLLYGSCEVCPLQTISLILIHAKCPFFLYSWKFLLFFSLSGTSYIMWSFFSFLIFLFYHPHFEFNYENNENKLAHCTVQIHMFKILVIQIF